jgi:hypothetical protein
VGIGAAHHLGIAARGWITSSRPVILPRF